MTPPVAPKAGPFALPRDQLGPGPNVCCAPFKNPYQLPLSSYFPPVLPHVPFSAPSLVILPLPLKTLNTREDAYSCMSYIRITHTVFLFGQSFYFSMCFRGVYTEILNIVEMGHSFSNFLILKREILASKDGAYSFSFPKQPKTFVVTTDPGKL